MTLEKQRGKAERKTKMGIVKTLASSDLASFLSRAHFKEMENNLDSVHICVDIAGTASLYMER